MLAGKSYRPNAEEAPGCRVPIFVETEQHELEPEGAGATGPEPDEVTVDEEDCGDTRRIFTAS